MAANTTTSRKGNIERVRNTETGVVTYRKVRANGTTRALPLLDGAQVACAKDILVRREAGQAMKAIAAEYHMSVSSVRRLLNSYALTTQHEANAAKARALQAAKAAKAARKTA